MIRILFIFLIIYFLVRIVGRLVMPYLNGSNPNTRRHTTKPPDNRKEGEVRVEYTNQDGANRKNKDSGEGEYIDFEELD